MDIFFWVFLGLIFFDFFFFFELMCLDGWFDFVFDMFYFGVKLVREFFDG